VVDERWSDGKILVWIGTCWIQEIQEVGSGCHFVDDLNPNLSYFDLDGPGTMFTTYIASITPEEQQHINLLVKEIKAQATNCGVRITDDDWQSIYIVFQNTKNALQIDIPYLQKHVVSAKMKIILS